jgi:Co/Zn/Cd efflux system component
MSDCCGCEARADPQRQSRVLAAVLGINLVMFFVEAGAGLLAGSAALLADSLDMLGDALVYAFSLYVVARSDRCKARSALLKGLIQLGFGIAVLVMTAYKVLYPAVPHAVAIGGVGLLALGANAVCAVLLLRHRDDDLNMNSVWLCSRNDLISNAAVIAAGGMVALTNAQWPDIVVGAAIALLFLKTSYGVIGRSAQGLRQAA